MVGEYYRFVCLSANMAMNPGRTHVAHCITFPRNTKIQKNTDKQKQTKHKQLYITYRQALYACATIKHMHTQLHIAIAAKAPSLSEKFHNNNNKQTFSHTFEYYVGI